jgi:membrane-associated PAP2 superfamily phosphatase
VEAHPLTPLDLNDSRLMDDYLDRAEGQSVDCREDLSRHLGRKTDAVAAARRVGARAIVSAWPAGHVSRPIQSVAVSFAWRSGSIAIFPTSMTTIAGSMGDIDL